MRFAALAVAIAVSAFFSFSAMAADQVDDALARAREAYRAGNLTETRGQLDTVSQLLTQRDTERLVALLPRPLEGWRADERLPTKPDAEIGVARRTYVNPEGDRVEVQIASDPTVLSQFGFFMQHIPKAMGNLVEIGKLVGLKNDDDDIRLFIPGKCLVSVTGNANGAAKIAFAKAIDAAKLSRL